MTASQNSLNTGHPFIKYCLHIPKHFYMAQITQETYTAVLSLNLCCFTLVATFKLRLIILTHEDYTQLVETEFSVFLTEKKKHLLW